CQGGNVRVLGQQLAEGDLHLHLALDLLRYLSQKERVVTHLQEADGLRDRGRSAAGEALEDAPDRGAQLMDVRVVFSLSHRDVVPNNDGQAGCGARSRIVSGRGARCAGPAALGRRVDPAALALEWVRGQQRYTTHRLSVDRAPVGLDAA